MKKIFIALAVLVGFTATSCVRDEQNPKAVLAYDKLVINEISGVGEDSEKYIEIYNTALRAVNLEGVQLLYDGELTWTGTANDNVEAGSYFVVLGAKKDEHPESDFMMSTGLSAKKNVTIILQDPEGKQVDKFARGDGQGGDIAADQIKNKAYSRIPDATGEWYFTDGTRGASNGSSTDGLTALSSENEPAEGAEVTVVLNELNGNDKFIELYNVSSSSVSLAGWKMFKDDGAEPNWIGPDGMTIDAGQYLALTSNETDPDYTKNFASGLSAKKKVKIELVDASGNSVDVFVRGDGTDWGSNIYNETEYSFARVPNGTGDWVCAVKTPGEPNGEKAKDIEN